MLTNDVVNFEQPAPGQGRFTNLLWLLSNGKLLPGYDFWVTYYMGYMFCHVNILFWVSQPYSRLNYKEIPPIYWMTLVTGNNLPKFIMNY